MTAEERLDKAWEFAQLIYWTVEHPNPKEAELLLDQWAALYATQPITRTDTNATQRNPA